MISNESLRPQAEAAINRMIDSGNAFKQLTQGLDKDKVDALAFTSAIKSGMQAPSGNAYTIEFNKKLNEYLGGTHGIWLNIGDNQDYATIAKKYHGNTDSSGRYIRIPREYAINALL